MLEFAAPLLPDAIERPAMLYGLCGGGAGHGGHPMESFLSAHELSALMLIEQAPSHADLDRREVEQLIGRQLVERAAGASGASEFKVTDNGSAVLTRIFAFDIRAQKVDPPA